MLGIQTGTTEASFTNRTQKVEDRISDIKDMKEEMDTQVKENVKYENSWHKTSRKTGIYYERLNLKNHRSRGRNKIFMLC